MTAQSLRPVTYWERRTQAAPSSSLDPAVCSCRLQRSKSGNGALATPARRQLCADSVAMKDKRLGLHRDYVRLATVCYEGAIGKCGMEKAVSQWVEWMKELDTADRFGIWGRVVFLA